MYTNHYLQKMIANSQRMKMSKSINPVIDFALGLTKTAQNECITVSPLSALLCLAMLIRGSTGTTKKEFDDVFGDSDKVYEKLITSMHSSDKQILITNSIYINSKYELSRDYQQTINHLGNVYSLDVSNTVSAARKINETITRDTNGLIQNMIQPESINAATLMLLINTVYLKLAWEVPFFKSETIENTSFAGTKTRSVDMMIKRKKYFRYFEDDVCQVVEMNCQDSTLCMGFVLPQNKKKHPLAVLNSTKFTDIWSNMQTRKLQQLQIPKFSIDNQCQLKYRLKTLGLNSLFVRAELDKMFENSADIFVSSVIQKVVLQIDETGVEMAACTVSYAEIQSGGREYEFIANRQFAYYIRDTKTQDDIYCIGVFD